MCKRVERICQVDPEGWYAPVIGQKLVRCKDCKHTYLMDNLGINGKWLMCKGHVGNTYIVSEDDFCSWAERKEE